jgi:AraC-like DNA-binding protein
MMNSEILVYSSIDLISMTLSLFLSLHFIFLISACRKANILLGTFFAYTLLSVLVSFLEYFESLESIIQYLRVFNSPILGALIIFCYALAITNRLNEIRRKYKWFILILSIDILVGFIQVFDIDFYTLFDLYFISSEVISLIIYLVLIFELKAHNEKVFRFFSSIDNKELNWLKWLTYIQIMFCSFWIVDDVLNLIWQENVVSLMIAEFSTLTTMITIWWLGLAGLRQDHIPLIQEEKTVLDEIIDEKSLHSFNLVVAVINEKKLFLINDLNLSLLATECSMKEKELSTLINSVYGNNFYHFINSFRIDFFKSKVNSDAVKNFTLEGLAKESGFNSKSTFYTAFKKLEGMTPKTYLDKLK